LDSGVNIDYLKELVHYWQNEFNWRKQEDVLNSFHQFKVKVDDYNIHFIKEESAGTDNIPLLMLHGWPDSFYRFHKIIPLLTDRVNSHEDGNSSFDLIVPSLPGFGFTECPLKEVPEQHMRHVAELLYKFMSEVLGYNRFAIVGGDGGSPLAQLIAINHPESVIGIYITDLGWHVSSIDQSVAK
jgi:microsomal epoxide hydrolase